MLYSLEMDAERDLQLEAMSYNAVDQRKQHEKRAILNLQWMSAVKVQIWVACRARKLIRRRIRTPILLPVNA